MTNIYYTYEKRDVQTNIKLSIRITKSSDDNIK